MKPEEILNRLDLMEQRVRRSKSNDAKTKYQVTGLFRQIKNYISYRQPMSPINVEDDGHLFECPRCNVLFESEYVADDFIFCPGCGQRFRGEEQDGGN